MLMPMRMPKVNDKFYHGALPARRAVLLALGWLLLTLPFATPEAAAITSITPVTWNVVGLDSNSPMAGPNRFPVGARVCSSDAETDFPVNFHWESDSDPTYINLTSSSPNPARIDIPAGGCADAYFEVEVLRSAASFEKARGYYIEAAGLETPRPRELYVKKLVSQARNGISALEYGTDPNNLKPVPAGESFPLEKGQTYYIRMSSYTAPGGYEQLETFSTLPTAIFQVLSVNTTYTADTTSNVSSPHDRLYADACYWESDPASPNYLACNGSGKIGGTMTVTYQVKIIDVGAGSNPIYSLVYDLSGASYHYNSDYSSSGRTALLVDPAAVTIDKRFAPATIAADGITTLIFTLTNPNGGAVSDVSFTDVFPDSPAALVVADPPNAVTSCVGTLYDSDGLALAAGDGGIRLTGGSIAGNSSCTVRVDVTAPSEDEYTNVSGNVWVGTVDTGDNATATLIVDNGYLPTPTPPSACTTRVEMARWNFDNLAAGSNFTPNSSFKDVDVATAAASIHNPARLTTSTISSAQSVSAANSWAAGGTNNNNTTGWQRGGSPTPAELPPGPTDAAFQFSVDSSKFGDVKIRFQGIRDTQWTGTNNYVRVHASGDNGTSWASAEITGLASNNWSVFTPALSTNGADTTLFRINAYYRGTNANAAGALMYLDDIIIDGCQLPDPPKIAKEFAPATVAVGESTTLNFVVTNPNAPKPGNTTGQPLAGISFEDTLPAGMTVTSGSTTVCGGTLTRTAPNLIAFSGGTLAAPASPATSTTCTIPVTVTATQAGSHDNVSGFIAADYAGSNTDPDGYATATLTVLAPPQIAKEFDPPIIYTSAQGSVATLTFTLVNPNPNHPLTDVAFTDTFPAGLVVANPPLTDNSCGGTLSDSSGAALGVGDVGIRLTGATIAAGGTCTVSVDVTSADPDYYENTSGAVTHTLNGADWGTDTAYAALLVIEPTPAIALSKQVGPGTYGPWAAKLIVGPGGDVVYRFTVENIGDVPLSNVSLSDPAAWVDPSTCVWADGDGDPLTAPFDLPVATAANDKHIAVCTLDPITAALSGEHPNTATAEGSWTGETATDFSTATYAISTLALLKSVAESYYTSAGTVLNYTYTVTNNGAASLTAPLTLTDNRIATVTCGSLAPDNELAPNESVICTATYTVTADDVAAGSITNVARALINGVYSPQAIVTVERVGLPSLLFLKSRQTFSDPVNGTSTPKPIPGAYVDYTLLVSNSGEGPAQSLVITDPIPANTQLFVGDLGQGGPVLFSDPDSDSGFAAPQPFTLSYSEDADCESYNYTPTADADGFDANVCRLRIAMDGSMSGTADPADPADFSLTFRVRID
jgi:uncharacterized repeat protein (TIGR01451 family)